MRQESSPSPPSIVAPLKHMAFSHRPQSTLCKRGARRLHMQGASIVLHGAKWCRLPGIAAEGVIHGSRNLTSEITGVPHVRPCPFEGLTKTTLRRPTQKRVRKYGVQRRVRERGRRRPSRQCGSRTDTTTFSGFFPEGENLPQMLWQWKKP